MAITKDDLGIPGMRKTHAKTTGRPCARCGGTSRYGLSYSCVTCTNDRSMKNKQTAEYKAQARIYWMKKRYGMTPMEFDGMLESQGGKCGCCGTSDPSVAHGWVIDHCHSTGKVRGILCDYCNNGLGRFGDSIERLQMAIEYLRKYEPAETIAAAK